MLEFFLIGEQNLLIGAKLKPSNQGPPRPIKPLLLTQTRYNPFLRNSKKKEENVQIGSALDSLTSSVQAASNIKSKTDESQSSSLLLKVISNIIFELLIINYVVNFFQSLLNKSHM